MATATRAAGGLISAGQTTRRQPDRAAARCVQKAPLFSPPPPPPRTSDSPRTTTAPALSNAPELGKAQRLPYWSGLPVEAALARVAPIAAPGPCVALPGRSSGRQCQPLPPRWSFGPFPLPVRAFATATPRRFQRGLAALSGPFGRAVTFMPWSAFASLHALAVTVPCVRGSAALNATAGAYPTQSAIGNPLVLFLLRTP